jgi:hypothetical protein
MRTLGTGMKDLLLSRRRRSKVKFKPGEVETILKCRMAGEMDWERSSVEESLRDWREEKWSVLESGNIVMGGESGGIAGEVESS